MALLTAACGGTSTGAGGSSSTGASTLHQEELAVARCMRSHGVPNFPDPSANGNIPHTSPDSLGVSNSVYQSALNACRHLAPDADATPSEHSAAADAQQVAAVRQVHALARRAELPRSRQRWPAC